MPFVTTWMDLQGIMLIEICQTQKDKYLSSHSHVNLKKAKLIRTENSMVVVRGCGSGRNEEMLIKGYKNKIYWAVYFSESVGLQKRHLGNVMTSSQPCIM